MKEVLKRIYSDFLEKKIDIIERETALPEIGDKIHTIIGPRRAGKTFFLYQIIAGLIKNGTDKNKMVPSYFMWVILKFYIFIASGLFSSVIQFAGLLAMYSLVWFNSSSSRIMRS